MFFPKKSFTLRVVFVAFLFLVVGLFVFILNRQLQPQRGELLSSSISLPFLKPAQQKAYIFSPKKLAEKADKILVFKSRRQMQLLKENRIIKTYHIALGSNPLGHKIQEGDRRTPEGHYIIDYRNPNSVCYLSLHISYPNEQDKKNALNLGVDPGCDIMIHGLPNEWKHVNYLPKDDWTFGCVGINDEEMYEVWHAVDDGTPIEIRP